MIKPPREDYNGKIGDKTIKKKNRENDSSKTRNNCPLLISLLFFNLTFNFIILYYMRTLKSKSVSPFVYFWIIIF